MTRDDITAFCRTITGFEPGLVTHRPESGMTPTLCFENVRLKVERSGGRPRYGWMFHVRRVERLANTEYLMAIHHAIWNAPNGHTFDVTPFHDEPLHHPITEDGNVVFLVDHNADPLDIRGAMAPLPMKFFAQSDSPEMKEYLRDLRRKEYQTHRRILEQAATAPEGSIVGPSGNVLSQAD